MAYKTKFLHFKTKASYEAERAKTTEGSEERKVFDAYISFIDEGPTICTWGKEYQCDANSLSVLSQELTTEEQNQVFKNLGWNVHIISQSDIDAGSSPSNEEKAKRLEATVLLVKETSLIYVRGNDDSANSYFFRISSSTQIEVLRISTTTGIIYPTSTQFIDIGAIRFDRTQTLSDSNKTLARENIDAANKNDVLPLTIDLSSQTVEDYNTALEAFNSKKPLTIFNSTDPTSRFTANVIEKEATTNDINVYFSFTGLNDVNTLNTIGYVGTIKPTGEKTSSFATIMPSNTDPKPLGPLASSGTDSAYSRSDHVHPIQESVAKLTTPRTIALTGAVSGSTTFDGSSNVSINSTLANIDASKITSGTLNADRLPEIPISKIPAAAMERLYVVESQSAAVALKIQEGDVVQIGSGGPMYFCISESASTFATKFKVFTAGAATSVPWSGVLNKPSIPEAAVDSPTRIDGSKSAAVGTSSKYAKEDHIHSTNTRMLNLNGTSYTFHSDSSSNLPMVYAPTSTGTSGQILKSTGGVPTWSDLTVNIDKVSCVTKGYGTYGDIPGGMRSFINEYRGDHLAFTPKEDILVEVSSNNGASWETKETTDAIASIFNSLNTEGFSTFTDVNTLTTDYKFRLTLTNSDRYCTITWLYLWISTNGGGYSLDVERYSEAKEWETIASDKTLSGWSGGNYISFTDRIIYNSSPNTTAQQSKIRLTFNVKSVNSSYKSKIHIYRISGYGDFLWSYSNKNYLAAYGTIYTWDSNKTVIFPAAIKVPGAISTETGVTTPSLTVNGDIGCNSIKIGSRSLNNALVFTSLNNIDYTQSTKTAKEKEIVTSAALAYWNGAYSGTGSNLVYCLDGEIASKTWVQGRGYLTSVPAQTWASITGKPTFATVATSGSYNDLTNKPTIPSLSGYATQNWVTSQGYLTSIPAATSSTYGGIQIGYTTSGKNYAVQLNNGKAYVNVPWTDTNTNYYPTSFTWKNGTTSGPTGSLTGSGMSAVSFGAIPSASATQSGVVTTGDQTFGGIKTIDTINVTNINEATPGEGFWIGYNTEGVIRIGKDGDYDFGTSGGTYSGTANTAKRLLNSLQFSNGQSFNGSSAVTIDLPEIPIALPNPYALTINGTSYTGSSAVSINTARILSTSTLSSSTVSAGYSYNNTSSRTISSLSGFSSSNPDSVIISTAKLTFTASNAIKMDGLADLSGTYYIYCLSYMANGKIAVNGAVYA